MRTLLYINVFLTITELLWTIMGTIFTVHDYLSCQQNDQARPVIVAVLVVVCLSYVLIGVKVSSLNKGYYCPSQNNQGACSSSVLATFRGCRPHVELSESEMPHALCKAGGTRPGTCLDLGTMA